MSILLQSEKNIQLFDHGKTKQNTPTHKYANSLWYLSKPKSTLSKGTETNFETKRNVLMYTYLTLTFFNAQVSEFLFA